MTTSLSDAGVMFADGSIQPNAAAPQINAFGATVAASALTITESAISLAFRSATLSSGAVAYITGTPANLVIPSGATLGTVAAVQSRLVILLLNNAGVLELAVVNIAGGNDLSETGVISTTAISAAANSANVIYSTTARTNVPYRVLGYVESTQATAGIWITAPSTIQGAGGQALAAMSSLGNGQTWQTVTRSAGTTYYNTTGKPIMLICEASGTSSGAMSLSLTVNSFGLNIFSTFAGVVGLPITSSSAIIPVGAAYRLDTNNLTIPSVRELR